MTSIKRPQDIETMRAGGRILARVLRSLTERCTAGFNVQELNKLADKMVREAGGTPSFNGYKGYPASLCVSVNSEVVHGLPRDYLLKNGDIVSLDLGVKHRAFHTDSAVTVGVGSISTEARRLIDVTKAALDREILTVRPGVRTGDLGHSVEEFVREHGFSVVKELVGHGIGAELQEDPAVPNFGRPGTGVELKEGMTIAIEPMVTVGKGRVVLADDGFTYKTADGSLAAHFEHTIAVTKRGSKILTQE